MKNSGGGGVAGFKAGVKRLHLTGKLFRRDVEGLGDARDGFDVRGVAAHLPCDQGQPANPQLLGQRPLREALGSAGNSNRIQHAGSS